MACCGNANWWVKVALLVILLAMIFDIVGVATNVWMYYTVNSASLSVGLWKQKLCNSAGTCTESGTSTIYKNDSFRATQVFEVFALIVFLIVPFVIAVYVFIENTRVWKFAVACMVLCFLAALFVTIGMIIWLTYVYSPFVAAWSMGFTIMAGILAIIALLLFIPELDEDPHFWWSRRYDSSRDDAIYSRGYSRGYYTSSPTVLYSSRVRSTPIDDQSVYLPPSRRSQLALPPPDSRNTKYNPIYESTPLPAKSSPPNSAYGRKGSRSPSITRTNRVSPEPPPLTPTDINTSHLRPATYNNVSDLVLQRDRVLR